jgi:redox-sensing transcriptional repressor
MGPRTVGRLSVYRRVLGGLRVQNIPHIFSRDLAGLAGVSPSLVRQDLMGLGYRGTSQKGYEVAPLDEAIGRRLSGGAPQNVLLVGVGNLGRAIMQYFQRSHPKLTLVAALDLDPDLVGGRRHGVPVRHLEDLERTVAGSGACGAILAVPGREAQDVADRLTAAGIRSILNFTTVRLRVPAGVYVENTDIGLALERVAFYGSRQERMGA